MVVISGPVEIGAGTVVDPFAHIIGHTRIGNGCRIHSHSVIGDLPQDRAYRGATSYCEIGDRTIIREGVTIHRGTDDGTTTVVGSDCMLMANSHIAHNCRIGNHATIVNSVMLGGHVQIGDRAIVSGGAAIHQFVRVGQMALVGILARVTRDVPPLVMTTREGRAAGLNVVGLRRAGYSAQDRELAKRAYRLLFRSDLTFTQAAERLRGAEQCELVQIMLDFLSQPSRRGRIGGGESEGIRAAA